MSYKESSFNDDIKNLKLLHPSLSPNVLIQLLKNMNTEIQTLKKKVNDLEDKNTTQLTK